jgi:hypothetical protein
MDDYHSEPSEYFLRAFDSHGSGLRRTCDGCGRQHYCSEAGFDFEEGELEELQGRSEKEPDRCIDHYDCSVSAIELGGKDYVIDCPCNGIARYEDFIWENRLMISDYLRRRADSILDAAIHNAEAIWMGEDRVKELEKKEDAEEEREAD